MEKRLVVSMAIGGASRSYGEFTFPITQKYAQKCGADFYVKHVPQGQWDYVGYTKFEYAQLLKSYDRILHIDADMIIRSTTPNLFDIVPSHMFAGVDEHQYGNRQMERPYIDRYQEVINYSGNPQYIPEFYINVGMYLFGQEHKWLFKEELRNNAHYQEQTQMNYYLNTIKDEVYLLPWNYNYMSLMDWAGLPKDEAHIVHYAGGYGGNPVSVVMDMMRKDMR